MKFTITGRIPSKKNSKRIVLFGKRPAIIGSRDYLEWKETAGWEIASQIRPQGAIEPINRPCEVLIWIFAGDKRKSDLSNKAESILDLLVEHKIIADDNWFIVSKLKLCFGGYDKANPRAVIEIK